MKNLIYLMILILFTSCGFNKKKENANDKSELNKNLLKPNIVLIYMDDLGWKDVGYAGSNFYETPNIDKLAASGMQFSRAYSPAPVCAPSRGAVVTGRSPARNKYTNVCFGNHDTQDDALHDQSKIYGLGNQNLEARLRHALGKENVLFSEKLQDAGYKTAYLGKWHNGTFDGFRPQDRGYEYVAGIAKKGDGGFYDHVLTKESIKKLYNTPNAKEGDYLADVLTDLAVDFMEENHEKPFMLHLSHYLVHGPIIPKKELLPKYQNKKSNDQSNVDYATMVESMDESVGRIIEKLEELKLLENTLILFTSDNGGLSLRGVTSNYPLRGGKSFAYEGGTRVPFLASWKNKINPNQKNETRVIGTDIYPTILAAAGLPMDISQHIDGKNLLPVFLGGELEKRPLYFHFPHYTHATSPYSSIISGDYKLIRYYNDAEGKYALFNLKEDIGEEFDLSDKHPEIVIDLDEKLSAFLKDADAEFPIPVDSEEGEKQLEKYYMGEILGFSVRGMNGWRIQNKKSERILADMERKCFEKMIQGDTCEFIPYGNLFEKIEMDTKRLEPFLTEK